MFTRLLITDPADSGRSTRLERSGNSEATSSDQRDYGVIGFRREKGDCRLTAQTNANGIAKRPIHCAAVSERFVRLRTEMTDDIISFLNALRRATRANVEVTKINTRASEELFNRRQQSRHATNGR